MELDEKFQFHCHPGVRYDKQDASWRQMVLKGKPSNRSLDFFYLCSYEVNGVREFLKSAITMEQPIS